MPLPNPTTNIERHRFRLCVPSFGRGFLWSLALLTAVTSCLFKVTYLAGRDSSRWVRRLRACDLEFLVSLGK